MQYGPRTPEIGFLAMPFGRRKALVRAMLGEIPERKAGETESVYSCRLIQIVRNQNRMTELANIVKAYEYLGVPYPSLNEREESD